MATLCIKGLKWSDVCCWYALLVLLSRLLQRGAWMYYARGRPYTAVSYVMSVRFIWVQFTPVTSFQLACWSTVTHRSFRRLQWRHLRLTRLLCPVHTADADATELLSIVASAVWLGHWVPNYTKEKTTIYTYELLSYFQQFSFICDFICRPKITLIWFHFLYNVLQCCKIKLREIGSLNAYPIVTFAEKWIFLYSFLVSRRPLRVYACRFLESFLISSASHTVYRRSYCCSSLK